jgi:hypothetical protein
MKRWSSTGHHVADVGAVRIERIHEAATGVALRRQFELVDPAIARQAPFEQGVEHGLALVDCHTLEAAGTRQIRSHLAGDDILVLGCLDTVQGNLAAQQRTVRIDLDEVRAELVA